MLQSINMKSVFSGVGASNDNINFYVKKELVKPINNKIIVIKKCSYKNHYEVDINYVYFNRLIKLNKITNKDTYREIINLVELCQKNQRNWWGVAEDDMIYDLTESINKRHTD